MKFIHCADIHLDSKMETNLSPQQAKERKAEILNTFENMVGFAVKNNFDGIIIAGDMFDTSRITNLTRSRILNLIQNNPSVDFFYLSGNHDESNFISMLENAPKNLKLFNDDWTTFACGKVKITGIVLRDNDATMYDRLNLRSEDFNIVVLHGQISKQDLKDKTEMINLKKLVNKNIDYLALGHIHSYTKENLDQRGVYCYSGCLEGRGFDECGDKGFVVLEVDENSFTTKFVPFAKRKLVEFVFDISTYSNWFDIESAIVEQTKNIASYNLLKIILTGKYKIKLDKQLIMLEQKLERFFFVKIKDQSVLDVTLDDVAKDFSLRGEFIRKVLSSNLSNEEKEATILVGLKSLTGEDL